MPAYLAAPRYVLGEIATSHQDIPGFADRARELGMPVQAGLWGWGQVHRTEKSLTELAVEVGKLIVGSADVDLLILCSTRFPGDARTHGGFVADVLGGLGLDCAFLGLTLNRCTNLVQGLSVAETFVRCGRYRSVLVITADRVEDESVRMESFALFSDGSAGCLVTTTEGEFEVLGSATAQDPARLEWRHEISAKLARQVNDALLTPHGLAAGDIAGLLHNNLYLPIVVMKEIQAGFTTTQLDTANVTRVGHCFAADPLINLADRRTEPGAHYLLAASVPGSRAAMLLRRTAVPAT
jgi:3-oxoacyl-[acyl-carrier-protein] synthase III